jgi:septal ring factor EnvC (AmiA/AmiB activator)
MCTITELQTRIKRKKAGLAQLRVNLLSPNLSEAEHKAIQTHINQCTADIDDLEQQIDDTRAFEQYGAIEFRARDFAP